MKRRTRNRSLIVVGVLAVVAVGVAATHDVSRAVTPADRAAVERLIGEPNKTAASLGSFEEEVAFAVAVQDAVLSAAPIDDGIPEGKPRELPDLIKAGKGLCFDRSRAIETVLRSRGFETRHASIYSTSETGSALKSLATPRTESHAITEMKTSRGWMAIDSNHRWIGLTRDGRPYSLAEIRNKPMAEWHPLTKDELPPIYRKPFTWVLGLIVKPRNAAGRTSLSKRRKRIRSRRSAIGDLPRGSIGNGWIETPSSRNASRSAPGGAATATE